MLGRWTLRSRGMAHRSPADHVLTLPDGRRLGYAVFGDPGGYPVVNCHGGLVSRNDVAPADARAAELGVRIISPDRPGVGLSDRHPGHSTSSWVRDDVTALVDHLGLGPFSVMGWSMGGQYALAVAALLPDLVQRCAVIAGCPPLDDARLAELKIVDGMLSVMSRRTPWLAHGSFVTLRTIVSVFPASVRLGVWETTTHDEAAAVAAQGDWMRRIMLEATGDPWGCVDEYLAFAAPWGFSLSDVACPVVLFQGDRDKSVPVPWCERLAAGLDDADVVLLAGEGHMIGLTRRGDVLERLMKGW